MKRLGWVTETPTLPMVQVKSSGPRLMYLFPPRSMTACNIGSWKELTGL